LAQLLDAPHLDAGRALGLARRWGAEAVLASALRLSREELGLDLDGELLAWAAGYVPRWRDRLWLRIDRPGAPVAAAEAVATALELDPSSRRLLLQATWDPRPGTWPRPVQRVRRVAARGRRALTGTT
jgi:hypothetical protein